MNGDSRPKAAIPDPDQVYDDGNSPGRELPDPWSDEERELQQRVQAGETVVASMRMHGGYENLIGWAKAEELFTRIDRDTDWGNPFKPKQGLGHCSDEERAELIERFEHEHLDQWPDLIKRLPELRGRVLGCWCAPKACHGHVLARRAMGVKAKAEGEKPSERLAAALDYATRGQLVFPLRPGTKNDPLVKWRKGGHGQVATTDHDIIRGWWAKWPDANIGIATGAESGFVVVDVDGHEGETTLAKLEDDFGQLPIGLEVRTNRGLQLYFKHPGGRVKNRQGKEWWPWGRDHEPATGVDVRGDGGMVCAPPSRVNDVVRTFTNDDPIAELPAGWVDILTAGTAPKESVRNRSEGIDVGSDPFKNPGRVFTRAEAEQYIETEALAPLRAATDGHRNGRLNASSMVVGHFVPTFWAEADAVDKLAEIAQDIGLDEDEIGATIDSGLGAGMAEPYELAEEPEDEEPTPYEKRLDLEVEKHLLLLRAKERAQRQFAAENADDMPEPSGTLLGDLLAEPDDGPAWRVASLWPAEGNVVFVAQRKAGKTTARDNLVRCLADGDDFLPPAAGFNNPGEELFTVTPLADGERVYIADLELSRSTLRRWLRDQRIQNVDRVMAYSFRGRISSFDVLDDSRREKWAAYLKGMGVRILIVDPLAALMSAYGYEENDNTGAGRLVGALDALKAEAGITELMVVHHMGHTGERGRGASRLRDWPDAEWFLVRERPEGNGEPPPDAARFFAAEGRDVAVRETKLAYNYDTRRLSLAGGTRTQHEANKYAPKVLEVITRRPGMSKRDLEAELLAHDVKRDPGRRALQVLISGGKVHTAPGAGTARRHFPDDGCDRPTDCAMAEKEK